MSRTVDNPLTSPALPAGPVGTTCRRGVYDNMGLEPVDDLPDHLLVSLNAGGLFVTGRYGRIPLVRDLQLAQSLLYRQSTALRRRMMVDRFRAMEAARDRGEPFPSWGRMGVLFGLATEVSPWAAGNPTAPKPDEVALPALRQL
jgi:hypothetical protein